MPSPLRPVRLSRLVRPAFALALLGSVAAPRLLEAQPSMVIVVRHAEKASATEADPVLSDAGMQRARDLAATLADARVGSVVVTQLQRTKLTAGVVSEAMALTPIVVPASANVAQHAAAVAAAVKARPAGEVVLVVGHSNTVTPIVAALGGPKLPDLCDSQYSQLFVLDMTGKDGPRLVRSFYGKPDPVDPSCINVMKK